VFCPRCHRKFSNAERGKYDPPRAVLVITHCPKCGQGGKEADETFLATNGKQVPWTEIERHITRVVDAKQ
jgi:ribosomal protein S27AE